MVRRREIGEHSAGNKESEEERDNVLVEVSRVIVEVPCIAETGGDGTKGSINVEAECDDTCEPEKGTWDGGSEVALAGGGEVVWWTGADVGSECCDGEGD